MTGKLGRIVTGKSGQLEPESYARLVKSVLYDKQLGFAARSVYGVLADHVFQGTTAKIGQRRVAKLLGCHQDTAAAALQELSDRGHIDIIGTGQQRRVYHLRSSRFGAKQRAGVEETAPAPSGGRRLVSAPRKKIV